MSLQEKELPASGPEKGPEKFVLSDDSDRAPDLDQLQKMSYLAGRSPSGTWSLVSLLDAPPGPEHSESP